MLQGITITGLDERFSPIDALMLCDKYDFLEFGVLMSRNNTGSGVNNRYPSMDYISVYQGYAGFGIQLSAHICGEFARDAVYSGNLSNILKFLGSSVDVFNRLQINVGDALIRHHTFECPSCFDSLIIQTSKVNFEHYLAFGSDNVLALMNDSWGRGLKIDTPYLPESGEYVGYAGGIDESNIIDVISRLDLLCSDDAMYWLDIESSVRTEDDWLSFGKCDLLCKKVADYMEENYR